MILVDTNILVRSLHPEHPHFALAERSLAALRLQNEVLCLAPQNLIEFWAVATRTRAENGLGMTTAQGVREILALRHFFQLLPYTLEVLDAWQRIVLTHGVSGKQTHDAHIAAIMQVHSVPTILTFNTGHFERFYELRVVNPADV